ncbi:MAG: GNAT family N-acetyltransferase [Clostridiales bacterium]|nr:GNAT family N-acetyltransferase [Clostridiales bacterium]
MKIIEVDNYQKLGKLFKDAGIEVSTFDKLPEHVIYAYEGYDGNKLIGGVSIEQKKNQYILFDIAVIPEYRKKYVGKELLLHAINTIKSLDTDHVYLVAKAPKFFAKYGFKYVEDKDIPPLFHCLTCDQYNVTCFPKVMRLEIK